MIIGSSLNYVGVFIDQCERCIRYVDLTRLACRFHLIGQSHVVGPDVELEALDTHDAAQDRASMDADPHAYVLSSFLVKSTDGFDHTKTHIHAAVGVIQPWLRTSSYTVIAVAKCRYLFAAVPPAEQVEASEKIVEQTNKLLGCFVGAHLREANNVSEQDADILHAVHVKRTEDGAELLIHSW